MRGEVKDEQYFVFICKADDPADYTNPIEHEKANPNYGVTIQPEEIASEALAAQEDPITRDLFISKRLNVYTNALKTYFSMSEVTASDDNHTWTLEELARLPIVWYGGADLSKMHDLTAGCLYGRYNDIDIVIAHGFIPRLEAHRKAEEDGIPFFWWEEEHWLTITNTEIVDYEAVVRWFRSMRDMGFKIKAVGYDRQYGRDFIKVMRAHKFRMTDQRQVYWEKAEGFREIERHIKVGKFYYGHNKAFEYCISNVKAVEDAEDRPRYEKTDDNRRIDLFDAAVIACKRMLEDTDKAATAAGWVGKSEKEVAAGE